MPSQTVTLTRVPGAGLGMTVTTDEETGTVRVASLVPRGVAEQSGSIHVGDIISHVNDRPMKNVTHEHAIEALLSSNPVMLRMHACSDPLPEADQEMDPQQALAQLALRRSSQSVVDAASGHVPEPSEQRTVYLEKMPGGGLGLKISSLAENNQGACVTAIVPGSPADVCQMIYVNDVIVSIDGICVLEMVHEEIIGLLARSTTIELVVSSDLSLLGLALVPDQRNVLVRRSSRGYGLRVTTDSSTGVVRIAEVVTGGPACESGLVFEGDIVEAVNGVVVRGLSHEKVVELLVTSDEVSLDLVADDSPVPEAEDEEGGVPPDLMLNDVRVVVLRRGDRGLGMKVSHPDGLDNGAVITNLIPGGAAMDSGEVFLNDVIVEIDGMNVLDMPHGDILVLLTTRPKVTLTLSSDLSLFGLEPVDRRVVTLKRREDQGLGIRVLTDESEGIARISMVAKDGAAAEAGNVSRTSECLGVEYSSIRLTSCV